MLFLWVCFALAWPVGSLIGCLRLRQMAQLIDLPDHRADPAHADWPTVSVLVPARNEELTLEPATKTLLALDYPKLEILLINDRSTDQTHEVMQKIASRDKRVRVIDVETLPPGWMGKVNALQHGLNAAKGEWLLFTDADVLFAPKALKRAMAYVLDQGYDHLSLAVHFLFSQPVIAPFCGFFVALMGLVTNFKHLERPDKKIALGVGAFQLVRRSAFDRTPGLEWLRMEPVEDIGLAYLLKESGARPCFFPDATKCAWTGIRRFAGFCEERAAVLLWLLNTVTTC